MRPAIKTPTDLFDVYSLETAIDAGGETLTRQEFADEADVNTIMRKFGVDALTRPVTWGEEIDYDLDLTGALYAKQVLDEAWSDLPESLRDRYQNWDDIRRAYEKGELPLKREEEPKPSPTEDNKPE